MNNCLFYALWKFIKQGGYIALRRCKHHSYCLHFLWSPDLVEWESFTRGDNPVRWWQKVWYRGEIKKGDE